MELDLNNGSSIKYTQLEPSEKLDAVLKHLNTIYPARSPSLGITDILNKAKNLGWGTRHVDSILNKLINEGYVEFEVQEKMSRGISGHKNTETFYQITFDGQEFIERGGYTRQRQVDLKFASEEENLKTLENRLKKKTVIQNRWLVAIGSVAAVYYLLEIVKFIKLNPHFFCSGH